MPTAYVLDFDGTITTADLTTELARQFGGREFHQIEDLYRRRKLGMREWLKRMSAFLPADWELLKSMALEWASLRPGFKKFARHCREQGSPLYIVSDGFGFYIEPVLEKLGCREEITAIFCNKAVVSGENKIEILSPYAHPICTNCGNCKAAMVQRFRREGWKVAYAGDGNNDRFGAAWSHYIYARDELAEHCRNHGLPHLIWNDFEDILAAEPRRESFAHNPKDSPFCRPQDRGYLF
ncbi:MAG: MtnX-like HAD-IB family phosphatase [Dethiobacteria bacterium]